MAEEQFLEVEGARLRCRVEGDDGSAPWIVFGNSLMTDLTVWDAQAAALAPHYRLLRYDQRGHGHSTASREPLDFTVLGKDLLAILDAFDIARCIYVGLSMGVPTGLSAYSLAPGRFDRLVFVDGMAKTAENGAQSWEERIAFATAEGMKRMAEATAQRWLQPESLEGPRGRILTEMIAASPLEGFVQCARALQAYDYTDEVGRIRCPLLAIAGAEDGAMPATMQKVFGPVSSEPVVAVPGAGHIPNFEQPAAFNAALLRFLSAAA
jgi:3-oxoadipate enol-lactonase